MGGSDRHSRKTHERSNEKDRDLTADKSLTRRFFISACKISCTVSEADGELGEVLEHAHAGDGHLGEALVEDLQFAQQQRRAVRAKLVGAPKLELWDLERANV